MHILPIKIYYEDTDAQGVVGYNIIVGRTGVTGGAEVVWTGLTDAAANQSWGCASANSGHSQAAAACSEHRKAVAEAEAASGLKVTAGSGLTREEATSK